MRSSETPPSATHRLTREHSPAGVERWLLAAAVGLFLVVSLPALLDASPLADDYSICMRPVQDGAFSPYLGAMWEDSGVVRPARYLEYALISTCQLVPFGLVMLVPLILKLVVAALMYVLLRDLRVRTPWPAIAAAAWMLEPLGTEAALWPAALHVHLGLALVLSCLLLHRHERGLAATVTAIAACFAIEQAIFVLPLAVWVTSPHERRRTATAATIAVAASVLAAYAAWPGENPRNVMTLTERISGMVGDLSWYVRFLAAGLGLHSGVIAFVWAFPIGVVAVAALAAIGALVAPEVLAGGTSPASDGVRWWRGFALTAAMLVLTNIPLIVSQPLGVSARTFTPTWLLLCAAGGLAGACVRWRRPRVVGVVAGTFVAFAALSLVLSVSVRLETAAFDRAAARWIAERTSDGDVVAVCDVMRVVVEPAPVGSFHLHALHFEDASWVEYHTGRRVEIRRSGQPDWGSRCPDLDGADVIVRFPQLVDVWTRTNVHDRGSDAIR